MLYEEFESRYLYNPIDDRIGGGGFGQVYKAKDVLRNRWVAIKEGFPIVGISWNDAVVYCKLLSSKTAKSYCLSTGAEQKYAACGWQSSNGNVYSDCTNIENVGWNYSYSDLHNMCSEANNPPKNFHQLGNRRSYTNIS